MYHRTGIYRAHPYALAAGTSRRVRRCYFFPGKPFTGYTLDDHYIFGVAILRPSIP